MSTNDLFLAITTLVVIYMLYRQFAGKVAPEKARELVKGGARLVDVRTRAEFAAGHIEGAVNIPVGELGARLGEVGDREKPVVVYCASGMRSSSAAGALRGAGFLRVHDLGAMARWG